MASLFPNKLVVVVDVADVKKQVGYMINRSRHHDTSSFIV